MSVTENRSPRRFRLTLTSWIFAGMKARVTFSYWATPSTFATCLVSIHLNGADNRTRAICSLPDLSLISISRTSCVFLATEPFLLDTYHRPLSWLSISLTQFATCFRFGFFLVTLFSFGCLAISLDVLPFQLSIWQNVSPSLPAGIFAWLRSRRWTCQWL